MPGFDIDAARAAKYSDKRIATFLAGQLNYDLESAIKATKSDNPYTDVADFLASSSQDRIISSEKLSGASLDFVPPTEETPAVDVTSSLPSEQLYIKQQRQAGQSTEKIRQDLHGAEANPWVDPVSAFVSGFGSSLILGKGAGLVAKTLEAGLSGGLNALMDIPISTIADDVEDIDSMYALPISVALGFLSNKIVEDPMRIGLLKGMKKIGVKLSSKLTDSISGFAADKLNADYAQTVRTWIGNKDLGSYTSNMQMQMFRQAIQQTTGEVQEGITKKIITGKIQEKSLSSKIDDAMRLWVELRNNPNKILAYKTMLDGGDLAKHFSPEELFDQQELIRLAQNLTPQQQEIARQGELIYKKLWQYANDNDVKMNLVDNFTNRMWDLSKKGKIGQDDIRKFFTTSRHQKQRVLETTLDGWMQGLSIKKGNEGFTRALKVYTDEINDAVNNKRFLEELLSLKDLEGNPLVTTKFIPGMVEVTHPQFKRWIFKGKSEIETLVEVMKSITKESIKQGPETTSGPIKKLEQVVSEALTGRGFTKGEADSALARLRAAGSNAESIIEQIKEQVLEKETVKGFKQQHWRDIFQTEDGTLLAKEKLYARADIASNLNNMLGVSRLSDPTVVGEKMAKAVTELTKANAFLKSTKFMSNFFHHIALYNSHYLLGAPIRGAMQDIAEGKGFMKALYNLTPSGAYKAGQAAMAQTEPLVEMLIKNGTTVGKVQDWEEALLRRSDSLVGRVLDNSKASKYAKDSFNALREGHVNFLFQEIAPGLKIRTALIELKQAIAKYPDVDPNKLAEMVGVNMNDDFGGLHLQRMGRNPTVQHVLSQLQLAPDWNESNIRLGLRAFTTGLESEMVRRMWARALAKIMFGSFALNTMLSATVDDTPVGEKYAKAWKAGKSRVADVDITFLHKMFGGRGSEKKYLSIAGHVKDPILWATRPISRTLYYKTSIVGQAIYDGIKGEDWLGRQFTPVDELIATHSTVRPLYTRAAQPSGISGALSITPSFIVNKIEGSGAPIPVQNLFEYWRGEQDAMQAILNSIGVRSSQYPPLTAKQKAANRRLKRQIERMQVRRRR